VNLGHAPYTACLYLASAVSCFLPIWIVWGVPYFTPPVPGKLCWLLRTSVPVGPECTAGFGAEGVLLIWESRALPFLPVGCSTDGFSEPLLLLCVTFTALGSSLSQFVAGWRMSSSLLSKGLFLFVCAPYYFG
jgi:hypothetical protein